MRALAGIRCWAVPYLLLVVHVLASERTSFFQDEIVEHDFSTSFSSHPMLYFTGADVGTLRRFANTSHAHLARAIRNAGQDIMQTPQLMPPKDYKVFGRSWNEGYGNNLPVLGMYVLLNPGDIKAFVFVRRYLDRLEHYRHWQVLSRYKEDLPVAHTLTGFATCLDMLYNKFDSTRTLRYMDKVRHVTQQLYESSLTKPWGSQYLNHRSITNYLAMFVGSMVVELHNKDATMWKRHTVIMLERNMKILSHIKDGSFSEGLGYGANTFRGISQYLYLLRRHLRLDHSSHPWLHKHIDFYLHTALPGLHRTLGVADTTPGWVYGPESQLHFLDSFVKKTGKGHWMAAEIRKRRATNSSLTASPLWYQRYVTLHTEYIWYNPNIRARPPGTYASPSLHEFKDWGVVTYRAGTLMDPSTTFLSFKSGKIHGQAIYELVHRFTNDEVLRGWDNFNPDHEHPDQNSFSFWPNGVPFVTEGLFGPKYPYLDSTLMFAPSSLTPCSHPFAGQMGSCKHLFKVSEARDAHGEVVLVSKQQGFVFISGEAGKAYHRALGVESFYRVLLLLHRELLVIMDHVHISDTSPLTHLASVFNNHVHHFTNTPHDLGFNGLGLRSSSPDDDLHDFKSLWLSMGNKSPFARITNLTYPGSPESGRPMFVSNAKITFPLEGPRTRVLYIFHGPSVQLKKFKVTRDSEDGISFSLDTGYQNLFITIATNHMTMKTLCSVTDLHSETTTLFTARTPSPLSENQNSDSVVAQEWNVDWNDTVANRLVVKVRKPHQPKETGQVKAKDSPEIREKMQRIANLTFKSSEYYARIKRAKLLQMEWDDLIQKHLKNDHDLLANAKPTNLWYSLVVIAISNLICCMLVILLLKISTASHRRKLLPLLASGIGVLFCMLFMY